MRSLRLLFKSMSKHSAPRRRLVFLRPGPHTVHIRRASTSSFLHHIEEIPPIRAPFDARKLPLLPPNERVHPYNPHS
jgi:hypothetical protein